jgi:hypothetical protein
MTRFRREEDTAFGHISSARRSLLSIRTLTLEGIAFSSRDVLTLLDRALTRLWAAEARIAAERMAISGGSDWNRESA